MEYKVTIDVFEGPMDLLLHLIEKSQIDIYEISINEITEQYLDYLAKMEDLDLEITSEFLVMAATLLEIKSKLLLPKSKDEGDIKQLKMEQVDPRLDLIRNLVEYKKYKYASNKLRDYEKKQSKIYYKPKEDLLEFTNEDDDLIEMDLDKLISVFKKMVMKSNSKVINYDFNIVKKDNYTVEKCIEIIKKKLEDKRTIKFYDLFDSNATKSEIISIFLALLELVKNKDIIIYQRRNFDQIYINQVQKEGEGSNG